MNYSRKNKYNNKKCTADNLTFDSIKEMEHYNYLMVMLRAGEISDLVLQPTFLLLEKQRYKGKGIRKVEYIADFMYYNKLTKETVVEDVKGYLTDIYKLKKKFFLAKYGDKYSFYEV